MADSCGGFFCCSLDAKHEAWESLHDITRERIEELQGQWLNNIQEFFQSGRTYVGDIEILSQDQECTFCTSQTFWQKWQMAFLSDCLVVPPKRPSTKQRCSGSLWLSLPSYALVLFCGSVDAWSREDVLACAFLLPGSLRVSACTKRFDRGNMWHLSSRCNSPGVIPISPNHHGWIAPSRALDLLVKRCRWNIYHCHRKHYWPDKFSVNYFIQFLTESLPEICQVISLKMFFGAITENTLPFTDPMTLRPKFMNKIFAMNYRMKFPNNYFGHFFAGTLQGKIPDELIW